MMFIKTTLKFLQTTLLFIKTQLIFIENKSIKQTLLQQANNFLY